MNEIFKLFLSLSVSGSIIALILFILKPILKDRFSKTWHYYIWFIVIARLILPFTIHNGLVEALFTHAENYLNNQTEILEQQPKTSTYTTDNTVEDFEIQTPRLTDKAMQEQSLPALTNETVQKQQFSYYWNEIKNYLWILWLGVSIVLLVRKVTSYYDFVRFIKAGRRDVTDAAVLETYNKACSELNINKPLTLYTNKLATAPMLVGIFRPFIVLPSLELSDDETYNILVHELTHYKRLDIFYKWITQVAVCLHWYNPLVYLISREINKNCELSCDEAIIKKLNADGKKQYGNTLITALKLNGNYGDTIVSITLNEDGKLLKERLGAIMKFKKKSKLTVFLSTFLAMIIFGGALTTGAYAAANNRNDSQHIKNTLIETDALNEADKRGIEIMRLSGTWGKTMEEVLPYMTNSGIDIAIEIYNQKHPGQEKVASDYYNSANTNAFNSNQNYVYNNMQKTEHQYSNSNIDVVTLNITDCPNVELNISNDEVFKYECYEQLYDIALSANGNELTLTFKQKSNSQHLVTGSMENYINISLPNYPYKKIGINGNKSGITLDEINTNLEINNYDTALLVYIPQIFNGNISCASERGSIVTHFYGLTDNYTFTLKKDNNSSAYLPDEFTDYQDNSKTYTFAKGNGNANIDFEIKSGRFYASIYEGQSRNAAMPTNKDAKNESKTDMDGFNEVDIVAIELMSYTQQPINEDSRWEVMELFIPNMSHKGIDKVTEIYNQYSSNNKKKASDYYNTTGADVNARALTLMQRTGMWKYVVPLFPYMSNEGIDNVVAVYNQKHTKKKISSDYYNVSVTANTNNGNIIINLSNKNTFNIAESGSFQAKNGQTLTLDITSTIKGGTVDFFLFDPNGKEQRMTIGSSNFTQEIPLTEGLWQYNCSGIFKDGGNIKIIGTIGAQETLKPIINNEPPIKINYCKIGYYNSIYAWPYVTHNITNNSDKTILSYQIVWLAYDKSGNPLELYWDAWNVDSNGDWGNSGDFPVTGIKINSPKSYDWLITHDEKIPSGKAAIEEESGWSLFDGWWNQPNGVHKASYIIANIKQVTYEDGTVWVNPEYANWIEMHKEKSVNLQILKSYYPYK